MSSISGVQAGLHVGAAHAATLFLAQPEGADPGGRGEGFGKSTPVGLLLLVLFLIAVAFLIRSMTKHLKRIPKSFEPEDEQAETADEQRAEPETEPGQHSDEAAEHEVAPSDETPKRTP